MPLADSITTWRGTVAATSRDGGYGASTFSLRVFQPFFVDLSPPVEVTRGDVVAVPAAVYNFDAAPRTVRLALEAGAGLRLAGPSTVDVDVAAGEVKGVKIPVEAVAVGLPALTATATSGGASDAVRRAIRVVPDGRRVEKVQSGILRPSSVAAVDVPADAVEGSVQLFARVYPKKTALNADAAARLLTHPTGCFEQTTSSSWPNAMTLALLEGDPNADPAVVEEARSLVSEGYQRILTFQSGDGGFSWWGERDEPGLAVTALGLAQLVDTSKVFPVDETAIARAAAWLAAQQEPDGSFASDTHLHTGNMSVGASRLRMTAYVAWALAFAGLEREAVAAAVASLKRQYAQDTENDAWTLSLAVMALDAAGLEPELRGSLAGRLEEAQGEDGSIPSRNPTMYYASGDAGTAENTAVGGLALLSGGKYAPAQVAATWVAEHSAGSWGYGTTQATVQSLRLLNSISLGAAAAGDIDVSVLLDGALFATETVTAATSDVMRQYDLSNLATAGTHAVELRASGESSFHYEVTLVYHLPWGASGGPESPLGLDVDYATTFLRVGDSVDVDVTVRAESDQNMPLVQVGLAPGFTVEPEPLDAAVAAGALTRWERKGQLLALYLDEALAASPVRIAVTLTAGMAFEGLVPASAVYPYYNPSLRYETPSFPIRVVE